MNYNITDFIKYYNDYDMFNINKLLKTSDINFYKQIISYIQKIENSVIENFIFYKVLNKLLFYTRKRFNNEINSVFEIIYANTFINKKGVLFFLKKNNEINLHNKRDVYDFSLILDCARYGDFNTFMYLLEITDKEFLYLDNYCNYELFKNIFSISIFNKDVRIFEYIYNNDNLNKHFIDDFSKKDYCINIIKLWLECYGFRNCNNYKKIIQLITIIDYPPIVNNFIYNITSCEIIFKLFKKYNSFIDITNLRQNTFIDNKIYMYSIYNILDTNNDTNNIKKLYILLVKKIVLYKDLISTIHEKYGTYFTTKDYILSCLNLISYNCNNCNNYCNYCNKHCDIIKSIMIFFNSKIDYNQIGLQEFFKYSFSEKNIEHFIHYLYITGLNRLFNFNFKDNHIYNKNIVSSIKKWEKTLSFLRKVIKKRKNIEIYSNNFKQIVNQVKFKSICQVKKSYNHNPSNLTLKNCIKLPNHFMITEKADGIKCKLDLINLYPSLDYFTIMNKFGITDIYSEKIKVNGKEVYFIHGDIELITYLRNSHLFISKKYNSWTVDNDYFVYNDLSYKNKEQNCLYKYLDECHEKKELLWWPKRVWNIDKDYFLDNLKEIKNYKYNIFKTDGWILTTPEKYIKLKSDKDLSIDILYKNNEYYYDKSHQFTSIKNLYNLDLNDRKIYRCYYNTYLKIWFPREERTDKVVPNNKYIVSELINYFKYPWNKDDIQTFLTKSYYHKKSYISFKDVNKCFMNKLLKMYCFKKNVFDIGCGFTFNTIRRKTKCDNYTGIDNNINILDLKLPKVTTHLIDITKDWSDSMNKLNETFNPINYDIILIINSIHFAYENIDLFIQNINKISKTNTKIIIKFLNKTFLKNSNDIITHNLNFVKMISNNMIRYYYSHCHNQPITEYIFSDNEIIELFCKYSWKLETQFDFVKNCDKVETWDEYMNCFSILIFDRL